MLENIKKYKFIISIVFGLLGIYIGIIGYIKAPELTYYVGKPTLIIDSKKTTKDIVIQYKNQKVTGNITARTITIWNDGELSIKKESIISALELNLLNDTKILQVILSSASNRIKNLRINEDQIELGIIGIDFDILEPDQPFSLDIIYSGDPSVEINLNGTIEYQTEINRSQPFSETGYFPYLLMAYIVFVIIITRIIKKLLDKDPTNTTEKKLRIALLTGIFTCLMGIIIVGYGSISLFMNYGVPSV